MAGSVWECLGLTDYLGRAAALRRCLYLVPLIAAGLRLIERGIEPIDRQQVLMTPLLNHPALIEDKNLIGVGDGGQSMGDDECRFARAQVA